MFFDMTYVYFVLPALFVAMLAQIRVKSVYAKYSKIPNIRGITGEQAARRVLDANGLGHIRVERIAGNLTDHYDPKEDVIRLSDGV
ncbi:MAG: zinc metallopeptidase, partial [Eubacteriales bacterium]